MSWYIGIYVNTCDLCNRTKLQYCQPLGELYPSKTPEEWWDIVSVNIIIELPESYRYDVIMNIVDSVSKHCSALYSYSWWLMLMELLNCIFERSGSTVGYPKQFYWIEVLSSLLMVSVYIWPLLYHINLLAMLDTPHQHIDLQLSGQASCQGYWCLASTIAHIRVCPCDPMAPPSGQWTSLGTVILLYYQ
jgi:hypothetical protein